MSQQNSSRFVGLAFVGAISEPFAVQSLSWVANSVKLNFDIFRIREQMRRRQPWRRSLYKYFLCISSLYKEQNIYILFGEAPSVRCCSKDPWTQKISP